MQTEKDVALHNKRGGILLVVAAHPDDEILGCGATVCKKVRSGWSAHLLLMTRGILGRTQDPGHPDADERAALEALQDDVRRAADIVGFESVTQFDFPDNRMDTVSRMDLALGVRSVVERITPDLLLTHHPGDYNWDHTQTFDAVMMAARVNPPDFAPREIRTFEVLSSTERGWRDPARAFHPTIYEAIEDTIDAKKLALVNYRTEYRDYPHPRSIEGVEYLARARGLEAGVPYAEAFASIRRIEH